MKNSTASAVNALAALLPMGSTHPKGLNDRSIAVPYVLSCSIGMPAAMCYNIWGTTCDADGDVINAATNIQDHGDCSDSMGHCTCVAPQAEICPSGERCVFTVTRPIPVITSMGVNTPTPKPSGSFVTVTITGSQPVIITRTATFTASEVSATTSDAPGITIVPITSASQLTLPVTGFPIEPALSVAGQRGA